jgi:formyltetrahydrofolate synthetase
MITFPGLSIGSSSSCFVAFALPLPFADSVVTEAGFDTGAGFETAAGFEKTFVGLAGTDFDVVAAGFCALRF